MWDKEIIYTGDLKPGMTLAEDLTENNGTILLAKGTTVNEKMLNSLRFFSPSLTCHVYRTGTFRDHILNIKLEKHEKAPLPLPLQSDISDKASVPLYLPGEKIDIEKELKPLPQRINQRTQEIYKDTLKTVATFYEKKDQVTQEQVNQTRSIANMIVGEIMRDPQILLQISALKAFDRYTFSHAVHVAIYSSSLAKYMQYPPEKIQDICMAALLHDIGKVDIPVEILNKPGPLANAEYEIMKEHVRHGYRRLFRFDNISKDMLQGIYQHHERIDGKGYLENLPGEKIHPWAKIIAIADVYDAITSDRVYSGSLLPHMGAEILMCSAGQLDMKYVQAFLKNMPIYPIGCKVEISTGEQGFIAGVFPNMPLRPIIQVVNEKGKSSRTVLLTEELTTFITGVLME